MERWSKFKDGFFEDFEGILFVGFVIVAVRVVGVRETFYETLIAVFEPLTFLFIMALALLLTVFIASVSSLGRMMVGSFIGIFKRRSVGIVFACMIGLLLWFVWLWFSISSS